MSKAMSKPRFSRFALVCGLSLFLSPISGLANNETKKSPESSATQAATQKVKDEGSDQDPRDGQGWFNHGYALHTSDRYAEAIVAFQHSIDLGYRKATGMYNIACGYALLNDKENALSWLERAIANGFDNSKMIESDPDINGLRADPRFGRIEKSSRLLSLSQFYRDSSGGSLYSKQQWAPAVKLYESLVQSEPNSGRAWFNLGYTLHYSREHAKAIEAFEHARLLGYNRPVTTYNIACAYSMLEQRELAFEWLERAVAEGYDPNGSLKADRDFDNLRSDPRFKQFISLTRDQKRAEK